MKNKTLFAIALIIISAKAFGQDDYTILRTQLPLSTEVKDYYVKKLGTDYILNGDIIVGSTLQRTMIYQSNNVQDNGYLWPKGGVPVKIDLSMYRNNNDRGMRMSTMALMAIDALNSTTKIRLIPYTGQKDYIRIMYHPATDFGGVSPIGKRGGEQIIYITRRADIKTVVHEMMHSLGFWHEQSRYDRDNYVFIDTSNILEGQKHNFQIEPGVANGAYDYESIMHYGEMSFAKDTTRPTIKCKNGNVITNCSFGSNFIFSDKDIAGINTAYSYNTDIAAINYETELNKTQKLDEFLSQQERKKIPDLKNAKRQDTENILVSEAVNIAKRLDIIEGLYKIKINQTGKHLAIEGISKENGARLVQWDYVDQNNHKFYVTKRVDNSFTLWGWDSRKYVSAASGNKEDGTAVIQDSFADHLGTWKIEYSNQQGCKPGWIITNVVTGKPLHLVGDGNGAGFELRAQQFQDGDYDCAFTFDFEKLKDDSMEKKTMVPLNNTQKMKKNN